VKNCLATIAISGPSCGALLTQTLWHDGACDLGYRVLCEVTLLRYVSRPFLAKEERCEIARPHA
jgi:hypothetical protein